MFFLPFLMPGKKNTNLARDTRKCGYPAGSEGGRNESPSGERE